MNVIIGTRGSKLALAQAEYVKNRLQKHYPQNSYELKIISTKGDREQKKALDQIGDKGLFVREIEQELLDGTISLAVHSMKDMPAEQPSGLVFAHAWKREDPRDVLILREAVSLEELPQHAVIGTGSRRRAFQLLQLRKDLRITGIRGNVDTRIKKMQEEQLGGIVLAAAGLHRLGRTSLITQYLFRSYGAYRNPTDDTGSGTGDAGTGIAGRPQRIVRAGECTFRYRDGGDYMCRAAVFEGNRWGLPYADRSICLQIARWKDAIAWNGRKCGWKQYKEM